MFRHSQTSEDGQDVSKGSAKGQRGLRQRKRKKANILRQPLEVEWGLWSFTELGG